MLLRQATCRLQAGRGAPAMSAVLGSQGIGLSGPSWIGGCQGLSLPIGTYGRRIAQVSKRGMMRCHANW